MYLFLIYGCKKINIKYVYQIIYVQRIDNNELRGKYKRSIY